MLDTTEQHFHFFWNNSMYASVCVNNMPRVQRPRSKDLMAAPKSRGRKLDPTLRRCAEGLHVCILHAVKAKQQSDDSEPQVGPRSHHQDSVPCNSLQASGKITFWFYSPPRVLPWNYGTGNYCQFPGITEAPFSSLGVWGKQLGNQAHISTLASKLQAPFANLTLRGRRKPEAWLLSAMLCCSTVLKSIFSKHRDKNPCDSLWSTSYHKLHPYPMFPRPLQGQHERRKDAMHFH